MQKAVLLLHWRKRVVKVLPIVSSLDLPLWQPARPSLREGVCLSTATQAGFWSCSTLLCDRTLHSELAFKHAEGHWGRPVSSPQNCHVQAGGQICAYRYGHDTRSTNAPCQQLWS